MIAWEGDLDFGSERSARDDAGRTAANDTAAGALYAINLDVEVVKSRPAAVLAVEDPDVLYRCQRGELDAPPRVRLPVRVGAGTAAPQVGWVWVHRT